MAYGKFGRKRARSTFRKKKTYGKKRVFKRRGKSMGARLKQVERKVRVLKPENKRHYHTTATPPDPMPTQSMIVSPVAGSGWFTVSQGILSIAQGVNIQQRVGNNIVKNSMYMKMLFHLTPPAFSEGYPTPQFRQFRVMIIQVPQLLDAFSGGQWFVPYSDPVTYRVHVPKDTERCKGVAILYDKVITWQVPEMTNGAGAAANVFQSFSGRHQYTFRVKPRFSPVWDNSDAGSVLNPVYVIFFNDKDEAAARPTIGMSSCQHYWKDNC